MARLCCQNYDKNTDNHVWWSLFMSDQVNRHFSHKGVLNLFSLQAINEVINHQKFP